MRFRRTEMAQPAIGGAIRSSGERGASRLQQSPSPRPANIPASRALTFIFSASRANFRQSRRRLPCLAANNPVENSMPES
jgi:hypothetical protein